MISLRSIAIWEPEPERSFSERSFLFVTRRAIQMRGGGPTFIDPDGDALPDRTGRADQNRAKVSPSNNNGLQGVRIIRSVALA